MKKAFASFVFIATLSASVLANNNPENAVQIATYKVSDSSVKLIVINKDSELVTVRIKDANGRVVFTDVIRNEERFSRKYVFGSDMNSGDYTIEVINKQGTASQSVTI